MLLEGNLAKPLTPKIPGREHDGIHREQDWLNLHSGDPIFVKATPELTRTLHSMMVVVVEEKTNITNREIITYIAIKGDYVDDFVVKLTVMAKISKFGISPLKQ